MTVRRLNGYELKGFKVMIEEKLLSAVSRFGIIIIVGLFCLAGFIN
jgi:hypothetical protein